MVAAESDRTREDITIHIVGDLTNIEDTGHGEMIDADEACEFLCLAYASPIHRAGLILDKPPCPKREYSEFSFPTRAGTGSNSSHYLYE